MSTKSRKYYTLVELSVGYAEQVFGDYDNKIVKQEMNDLKYGNRSRGIKTKYKIVMSMDNQSAINDAISELDY